MLNYSETSENAYLAFNQHIGLKNKKIKNLVHLTFKLQVYYLVQLLCKYIFYLAMKQGD